MNNISEFTFFSYTSLPTHLKQGADTLDTLCFRENFIQSTVQRDDQDDKFSSKQDLIQYILMTENDEVIGQARVFKRTILFEGKSIVLGGIGSVGVHPKYRSKGLATGMLKKAIEILKKEKCDVAYLCADIYTEKALLFYEQFGFTLLPKPHTYLGKSGKRYVDSDGMIAPITSKKIFQEIIESPTSFDIGIGNW